MVINKKNVDAGLGQPGASNMHRIIRFIYALFAVVFFICIVLQVFLAGAALFSKASFWSMHTTFAIYFEMVPVIMFLLSFFGGIRGRLRWICLGLYALISFQHMSIQVFSDMGLVAALHPIVALILFWGSLYLVKSSWQWLTLSKK